MRRFELINALVDNTMEGVDMVGMTPAERVATMVECRDTLADMLNVELIDLAETAGILPQGYSKELK